MRKRLALGLFSLVFFLSGCWDKVELENRGFVISLAIDKSGSSFAVAMTLPDVASIAGKDGGGANKSILRAESGAVSAAMHSADTYAGQKLYYGHTKMAVLGADCLADAKMVLQAFDALTRNAEISQKLVVLAAEADASAVLDVTPQNEPLVGTFVSNFYKNNADSVNVTVKTDLEAIWLSLRRTGHAIIPRIAIENDEIKLSGAAVLKDGALAGWLDEAETRGLLWLRGEGKNALLTVEYDGAIVPLQAVHCARELSFAEDGKRIVCRVGIQVSGSVEEMRAGFDEMIDEADLEALARLFAEQIEQEVLATFDKLQTEFGMDGLDLRNELYKRNPALLARFDADWDGTFAGMAAEVSAVVSILR